MIKTIDFLPYKMLPGVHHMEVLGGERPNGKMTFSFVFPFLYYMPIVLYHKEIKKIQTSGNCFQYYVQLPQNP